MKNSGEIRIGLISILFIALIVAVFMGKASFWHIIFFPFYVIGGALGIILGILFLIVIIIGITYIIGKFL